MNGIMLFHILEENIKSIDKNLIGGFLSAFMNTLKVSSEADIEALKFKDSLLIFHYSNISTCELIFLSRVNSKEKEKNIRKELNNISKKFIELYENHLKNWCGNINIFKDFHTHLNEYFIKPQIDI